MPCPATGKQPAGPPFTIGGGGGGGGAVAGRAMTWTQHENLGS